MNKLFSKDDFILERLKLKKEGKPLVTTNGCFDILHVGHVRYLNKARSLGEKLCVLLNSDRSIKEIKGESRPINNENERSEVLSALTCVDYVVIFDDNSPKELLGEIKPDIHTKGADWTIETLPEASVILEAGGRVEFIDFVEGKSTTSIIEKMKN